MKIELKEIRKLIEKQRMLAVKMAVRKREDPLHYSNFADRLNSNLNRLVKELKKEACSGEGK